MRYFRVVIALLASLCTFFGYACRLNLSLVIESMVQTPVHVVEVAAGLDAATQQRPSFAAPIQQTNFFQTEDLTYAKLFKPIRPPKSVMRACLNQIKLNANKTTRNNRLASYLSASPKFKYAIDFNVGKDSLAEIVHKHLNNRSSGASVQSPATDGSGLSAIPIEEENLMQWTESQRNDLLLAFFLGYVIFQIPSARAAEIFGSNIAFMVVSIGTGVCSLLFPIVAELDRTSITYVYILRVIMGACQSSLFASSYIIIGKWMPTKERSRWLPYPAAFSRLGTIVMNIVIPPVLYKLGWPYVFYLSGTAMLAWAVVFLIFGSNSPEKSIWISDFERHYIESNKEEPGSDSGTAAKSGQLKTVTASNYTLNEPAPDKQKPRKLSWSKLVLNRPILMLSMVMFAAEWSNMLILIKLPGFLGPALKFSLEEISLISSVLVGIFCIHYPLCGYIASLLDNSDIEFFNTLRVRKTFEAIASLLQGGACLLIASTSDKWLIISGLVLITLGRATVGGGQCLIPPELSRDFSGTVLAFANTFANVAGILGPKCVNWLVDRQDNYASWIPLWLLSAAIFFSTGLIFLIFGDNGPQDYRKKPKSGLPTATSVAQLTLDKDPGQVYSLEAPAIVFGE